MQGSISPDTRHRRCRRDFPASIELSRGGQKGIYGAISIALDQFLLRRSEDGVVLLDTLAVRQLPSSFCTYASGGEEDDHYNHSDHHSQRQAKTPFLTCSLRNLPVFDLTSLTTTLLRDFLLNIAS